MAAFGLACCDADGLQQDPSAENGRSTADLAKIAKDCIDAPETRPVPSGGTTPRPGASGGTTPPAGPGGTTPRAKGGTTPSGIGRAIVIGQGANVGNEQFLEPASSTLRSRFTPLSPQLTASFLNRYLGPSDLLSGIQHVSTVIPSFPTIPGLPTKPIGDEVPPISDDGLQHRKVIAKSMIEWVSNPGYSPGASDTWTRTSDGWRRRSRWATLVNETNNSFDEGTDTPEVNWDNTANHTRSNPGVPRLLSWCSVKIKCENNTVALVEWGELEQAMGAEPYRNARFGFYLFPEGGVFDNVRKESSSSFVYLSYRFSGHPHWIAELALSGPELPQVIPIGGVASRTSINIWHRPAVLWVCKKGAVKRCRGWLRGSKFPTHKAWDNGKLFGHLKQGPYSALWNPLNGEPSHVIEADTIDVSGAER